MWAAVFVAIAGAHFAAAALDIDQAYTVFNWIVPISLCVIGAHLGRTFWFNWTDELELEEDPLHAFGLDYSDDWDTSL
jgi:hypothetical protein